MDALEAGGLDRDAFVARFGGVFENSQWVAERAWAARPFGSLDALFAAMADAVERAPREVRMALIRAHPDLAANTSLTDESEREQAAAGLDRLTQEQFDRITFFIVSVATTARLSPSV